MIRKYTTLLYICVAILSAGANAFSLLKTEKIKLLQYQLSPLWFTPFIQNGACLGSVLSDPKESEKCVTWTRRETAGPTLDISGDTIYVGGTDGFLHTLDSQKGTHLKKAKLPSNLVARPTLSNERLYFGTESGDVLAYETDTLKKVWQTKVDAEVLNDLVLDNETLYFTTGLSTLYALDMKSGQIKWSKKRPLPSRIVIDIQPKPLIFSPEFGKGESLIAVGHPTGNLNFYKTKNGTLVNSIMIGDPKNDFPDVVANPVWHKDSVIAASYNKGIFSLEPSTGDFRWQVNEKGTTRLAASNDMIFAAVSAVNDENKPSVIGIDAQSGKKVWRYRFNKGSPTNLVVKNGFLYFASDRDALYVLEAATGKPMRYFGSGLGFAGAFDFSSEVLFLVSTAGYLYAMSPDYKGFVQRGNKL